MPRRSMQVVKRRSKANPPKETKEDTPLPKCIRKDSAQLQSESSDEESIDPTSPSSENEASLSNSAFKSSSRRRLVKRTNSKSVKPANKKRKPTHKSKDDSETFSPLHKKLLIKPLTKPGGRPTRRAADRRAPIYADLEDSDDPTDEETDDETFQPKGKRSPLKSAKKRAPRTKTPSKVSKKVASPNGGGLTPIQESVKKVFKSEGDWRVKGAIDYDEFFGS